MNRIYLWNNSASVKLDKIVFSFGAEYNEMIISNPAFFTKVKDSVECELNVYI